MPLALSLLTHPLCTNGRRSYVGEQWKKLGERDRAKYEALAEEDRRRYHRCGVRFLSRREGGVD